LVHAAGELGMGGQLTTWVMWSGLVFQILALTWGIFLIKYACREASWWKRLGDLAEKQVWFLTEFVGYWKHGMPRNAEACARSADQVADEADGMLKDHRTEHR